MQPEANVDAPEIKKFDALAHRWWDPNGDFKPLHDINPARLEYISQRTDLSAGPTVDIGCGGGILSESMASAGSATLGIDMAGKALGVAKLHALEAGVDIEYLETTAEQLAHNRAGEFRTVTCMEMLEHVTAYADTVKACAELAQPGGDLFFSTINRNPKSYVMLILGAEYILNILPRGTHGYSKFIKPSELAQALRDPGLDVLDIRGLHYNPLTRSCRLNKDTSTNYIVHARKPV